MAKRSTSEFWVLMHYPDAHLIQFHELGPTPYVNRCVIVSNKGIISTWPSQWADTPKKAWANAAKGITQSKMKSRNQY